MTGRASSDGVAIHRMNNERVEHVRDLVWRLRTGVRQNEARVIAISDYLARARERTQELQRLGENAKADGTGDPRSLALDLTLQELSTSHEELRVADEELRARTETLARWEREVTTKLGLHRRLFEHAPIAFFVTDAHGVIVDANQAATKLLNVPIRFLTGKPIINFVARGDVRHMRTFVHSVKRDSDVRQASIVFRPRNGGVGKGVVPCEVSAGALETEGALVLGWLVREVPAGLAPSTANAEASAEERELRKPHDDALAMVAHALRGPLQTIQTAIERLEGSLANELGLEQARRECALIARSTDALTRLVSDLRATAPLGDGGA